MRDTATYMLVQRQDFKKMHTEVNRLIGEGWKVKGGISTTEIHDPTTNGRYLVLYTQVMIKGATDV